MPYIDLHLDRLSQLILVKVKHFYSQRRKDSKDTLLHLLK